MPARLRRRYLALAIAGAVVLFALGVAVGQALEDGRSDQRLVTRKRTLVPLTVVPPARTVTGRHPLAVARPEPASQERKLQVRIGGHELS